MQRKRYQYGSISDTFFYRKIEHLIRRQLKAELEASPNAQLKAFTKVYLQPGEEKTVQLHLPIEAFALFDDNGKQKVSYGGQKPLQIVLKAMNSIEIE